MSKLLDVYGPESMVTHAYAFAEEAHRDAKRASGEPYVTHVIAVAETVHAWGLDEPSVAAALLHDVVEDTEFTLKDVSQRFGDEIASLVDGLTKLKHLSYSPGQRDVENLRKLVISFTKDLRVLLVKLADRLHNMHTLASLAPERQRKIALETTDVYAPLAYRLGMQKLSGELEDLALPYTNPEEYQWLIENVESTYEERREYATRVQPVIAGALTAHGIHPLRIDSRAKRYASLYKKLLRYGMDLSRIYDLVAVRIIVSSIEECYAALGVVHSLWTPIPGQFDDYIARPKSNGYRSLHTTVSCIDNKITEFQIRTKEMDEEAELGIAAHWAYQQARDEKHYVEKGWRGLSNRSELRWVEQLRNWQQSFRKSEEFIEALKTDLFRDRIFVSTPKNDVVDLPAGSTPVDFAYRIHSEVGDATIGAKINGRIAPLDYELSSGDMVEIMTQRGKKPSESWLSFLKTELARKRVRSTLRRGRAKTLVPLEGLTQTEFTIVNKDRPGFLKEAAGVFAQAHVNITYAVSQSDARGGPLARITIRCAALPKEKLEKIVVRLKSLSGAEEVRYTSHR